MPGIEAVLNAETPTAGVAAAQRLDADLRLRYSDPLEWVARGWADPA
jgi:hypothetical protein